MQRKTIAVLGATGSVGTQTLDVARSRGYRVDLLSANSDIATMESLAREFSPRFVIMANEHAARELSVALGDTDISVGSGADALDAAIHCCTAGVIVNAVSGFAGLAPTLSTIDSGRRLAIANKESLVVAGEIVMSRASDNGVEILPVDSEHSAIFQSLKSGKQEQIKRILLTASGGPFRDKSIDELRYVTLSDTLAHPTWKMGERITVDSATLMNKGFELIEAVHLFGVAPSAVEVLIHRESILHSAVEYIDNSVIGELSVPDMRMCVQYAVDYPERCVSVGEPLDLTKVGTLSFERPRYDAFPLLSLASRAISEGGAMPAVMNAADEVAVEAFLREEIGFTDIAASVEECYERLSKAADIDRLDGIIESDREARAVTREIIHGITR